MTICKQQERHVFKFVKRRSPQPADSAPASASDGRGVTKASQ